MTHDDSNIKFPNLHEKAVKNFLNYFQIMLILNGYDFIASVVIALRAADIVTNKNALHIVHSTHDSCGKNCAVANVIEETGHAHAIWQEVYPNDRQIHLGAPNSATGTPLGQADEQAGHGNYVFVLWRHYRGCVQDSGHLWWASHDAMAFG